MKLITEKLAELARRDPSRELLDASDGNLTYEGFLRRAESLAHQIEAKGIVAGESVGIIAKDYVSTMSSLFGCWLAGAVAIPINIKLPEAEKRRLLKLAKTKLILSQGGEEFDYGLPLIKYIEIPSRVSSPKRVLNSQAFSGGRHALILFTSGSTGTSKGVCLTLEGLSKNAALTAERMGLTEQDSLFLNTPPYFTSGLCHFLTMLSVGGRVVSRNGFQFGASILEQIEKYSCTGFGGAPTHLRRVVETAKGIPAKLKFWMSSGDHLPLETLLKAKTIAPQLRIFTVYGLTEVSGRLCIHDSLSSTKLGSVGKPIQGMHISIKNEAGNELKSGEVGEVVVSGGLLMRSYLGDDPTLVEFRTGDLGYLDEEGFLWLKGRLDDVFKSGAEKVSTWQIQDKILESGMAFDVAVVAREDAVLGKVPHAYVVPTNRFNAGTLKRYLEKHLLPAQVPRTILSVDKIPRTGSGKVERRSLEKAPTSLAA